MRASEMPFILMGRRTGRMLRGRAQECGVRYGDPCGWIGAGRGAVFNQSMNYR